MADGKNIEIKIAATGGDQAAAEVRKVETAAQSLTNTPTTSTGFGGMLDKIPEQATKAEKKVEDLGQTVDDLVDSMEKVSEETKKAGTELEATDKKTGDLPNKSRRLKEVAAATGAIGIAAAAAAQTMGQVKDALESVDTRQLRAVDSAMADNIESAKNWATALEDPIGMLLKLVTGETVASAFEGLNDQLQRNAEMTSEAVDRFIAKSSVQLQKIQQQAADLKAANALLDAKADTAATEREGKNAERIRNGEAPEDVAAEEAKIQAAEKIAKIERDQAESRVGLQEKYDASVDAGAAAKDGEAAGGRIDAAQGKFDAAENALKTDNFTSLTVLEERRDAARNELEETKQRDGVAAAAVKGNREAEAAAKKAFEEQKKKIEQEDAIANERKANIRAGAANKVADAGARKGDRLETEKSRREDAGFEARKNFQDFQDYRSEQAVKGRGKSETDRGRAADEAGRQGRAAERLLPEGVSDKFRKAVESVSDGLQDGDQGGEVEKLLGLMEQLAAAVQKKGDSSLARRIEILEQQIRNK